MTGTEQRIAELAAEIKMANPSMTRGEARTAAYRQVQDEAYIAWSATDPDVAAYLTRH